MVQAVETKARYPRIPAKNWWDLRRRFRQSPPREVNSGYLQTVLNLSEGGARNLLPSLKTVGLIDEAGKPTERAMQWRDDEHCAEVCEQIRQEVYPQGLLDALPPPNPDRKQVERWFARETGTGEVMAKAIASFYLLVCQADVAAADRPPEKTKGPARVEGGRRSNAKPAKQQRSDQPMGVVKGAVEDATPPPKVQVGQPSLSVAIQIYIDSSASTEQIDQMFASMARHLYGKE